MGSCNPGTAARALALAGVILASGAERALAGGEPPPAAAAAPEVRTSAAAGPGGVTTASGGGAAARFAPGRLVVRYRDSVTQSVADVVNGGKRFRDHTADRSDSLDRLHAAWAVRGARPVFRTAAEERALAGKDLASLKAFHRGARARAEAANPARAARAPARADLPDPSHVYVLSVGSSDVEAAARAFRRDPHVEWAHPDYVATTRSVPDDPYFSSSGSWGQPYRDLWNLEIIRAAEGWDLTQGSGALVAVVDSGADLAHPDLAPNLVPGWDFVAGDPEPDDLFGHGTHVAGTIAAVGDNGLGVVGVAPQARVMPLKALDDYGSGFLSDLAAAIRFAADAGADVINNSWGCSSVCPSVSVAEDAVRYAHGLGAVIVFAAGNMAKDVVSFSPQNMPEVVVVAATDHLDERADFSNFGFVDVAAPGGESASGWCDPLAPSILSVRAGSADLYGPSCGAEAFAVGDFYYRLRGTSMAAPHVSGLAALLVSLRPDLSSERIRQAIRAGSVDVGPRPGVDADTGYGRIDVPAALAQSPLAALITRPAPGALDGPADVHGVAYGPGLAGWTLELGVGGAPESWTAIASSTTPVAAEAFLGTLAVDALPDGPYALRLTAVDASGRAFEDRQGIWLDRVTITEPPPPVARLNYVRPGEIVTIRGTAATGDFAWYAIGIWDEDGVPVTEGLTVADGGLQKVTGGVLGTWDTTGVAHNAYTISLEVWSVSGEVVAEQTIVVVDPDLRPGWPVSIPRSPELWTFQDEFTAADVDLDGRVELLAAYDRSVHVLRADGTPLPGWPQTVADLIQVAPAAADVLGTGSPQVVAIAQTGLTYVWRPDGTLADGWPKYSGAGGTIAHVAIDDVTGDGANDLVTVGGRVLNVLDAQGNAHPGWPQYLPADLHPAPAVGDVDLDGRREIAVVGFGGSAPLYLLDSAGSTLPGWPVALDPAGVGLSYCAPAMGDVDGDGLLEVVASSPDGSVHAFRRDGVELPGWPVAAAVGAAAGCVTLGDLDGDRRVDVIAGADAWTPPCSYEYGWCPRVNQLHAWRGDATPLPGWPATVAAYDGFRSSFFGLGAAALADVDGDGLPEAIATGDLPWGPQRFHTLHAFEGDSEAPGFPKLSRSVGAAATNTAAVADFDGDGRLELAWADLDQNVYLSSLPSGAASARPWPMYQHDARHSGAQAYIVKATRTPGGSLAPSGLVPVNAGASRTFTVAADRGYRIEDVRVDGVSVGALASWTFADVAADHDIAAAFAREAVTVLAPNGGEVLASGSRAAIRWSGSSTSVTYDVSYRVDDGASYTRIASGVAGTSLAWRVPALPGNARRCRVRVEGFNASRRSVGRDVSDQPFAIEVIRLAVPNGGETLRAGSLAQIAWTTNATARPVTRVALSYSVNGGTSWMKIADLSSNPGTYAWKVPAAVTRLGRVRVELAGSSGPLGSDSSDGVFEIVR